MREIEKTESLAIEGGIIPINLYRREDDDLKVWGVDVDGVEWLEVENPMHAAVLFNMMVDHITDYMHYEITR